MGIPDPDEFSEYVGTAFQAVAILFVVCFAVGIFLGKVF